MSASDAVAGQNLVSRILDALDGALEDATFSFQDARGHVEVLTSGQMADRIAGFARGLGALGIAPGTVTPIVAGSSARLWAAFVGAMAADLVPCLMATPTFKTHMETYVKNLTTLLTRYKSGTLLVDQEYAPRIEPLLSGSDPATIHTLEAFDRPIRQRPVPGPGGDRIAFLQHSSGSTGTPKGVVIDHRMITTHLDAYARAIGLTGRDRICSWLPLYHDMGLITSFLLPLARGVSCFTIPPQVWILDPLSILDVITRERSTFTWWPNFTYALLASRARPADLDRLDLRSMRMFVNCAEPVLAPTHDLFLSTFERCGVDRSMLRTCYAMAETVYAISQSTAPEPRRIDVTRESLELGRAVQRCSPDAPTRQTVLSSGALLDEVRLKVVNEARFEVDDGTVGEIALTSPFLFNGYHLLPEASSDVLADRWYYTGDIGFIEGGELFVLGRSADLINVGGRKFYAGDVERIVATVDGVKEGRAVAFGCASDEKGTAEVVVLVESAHHDVPATVQTLNKEIKLRVLARLDCAVDHVGVLAPRTLIKTSSGKIARSANRRAFLERWARQRRSP
ncbi:MAG: AMP-binding protein [Candidatus Riflebacteria bacterium]|nr:AMP-binding protein [Candidatus Riflebacteria bacterium]